MAKKKKAKKKKRGTSTAVALKKTKKPVRKRKAAKPKIKAKPSPLDGFLISRNDNAILLEGESEQLRFNTISSGDGEDVFRSVKRFESKKDAQAFLEREKTRELPEGSVSIFVGVEIVPIKSVYAFSYNFEFPNGRSTTPRLEKTITLAILGCPFSEAVKDIKDKLKLQAKSSADHIKQAVSDLKEARESQNRVATMQMELAKQVQLFREKKL